MTGDHVPPDRNHISVMTLPILNSCLTFIKYLMASKDKNYIQDAVVSRFSLEAVMTAREELYKCCCPMDRYAYRGPNKVINVRDRSIHAFEGIYTKLIEVDALNVMPVIACPSEDLGMLLRFNSDSLIIDTRFQKLESEISDLKPTFHRYTEVVASSNQYPTPDQASAIPPVTRRRLGSESFKRRRMENGVKQTGSSDVESEGSANEDEQEEQFHLPREQARQVARRSYSDKVKAYSQQPATNRPQQAATNKPKRRPAIWGKATVTNGQLSGNPPEIMMFNCRLRCKEEHVMDHFKALGIDLVKASNMTTYADARTRSFRLTVSSISDYDKIMTGELTDQCVGVRRFIPKAQSFNKPNDLAIAVTQFLNEPMPGREQNSVTPVTSATVLSATDSDTIITNDGK